MYVRILSSRDGNLSFLNDVGSMSPSQSMITRWVWGFHTVRGGVDPGDRRFFPRFVGVVYIWKDFFYQMMGPYPPRVWPNLDCSFEHQTSRKSQWVSGLWYVLRQPISCQNSANFPISSKVGRMAARISPVFCCCCCCFCCGFYVRCMMYDVVMLDASSWSNSAALHCCNRPLQYRVI